MQSFQEIKGGMTNGLSSKMQQNNSEDGLNF